MSKRPFSCLNVKEEKENTKCHTIEDVLRTTAAMELALLQRLERLQDSIDDLFQALEYPDVSDSDQEEVLKVKS